MKIALYSDLHLELRLGLKGRWTPPSLDVDVVVLAGDIHLGTAGIAWANGVFRQRARPPEILYVAGNHEFYGFKLNDLRARLRRTAAQLGIHLLENEAYELDGVRFLGTPLWTDFSLHGNAEKDMQICRRYITDYSAIWSKNGGFVRPEEIAADYHQPARSFLETELTKPYSGKTVVITHFAPHPNCVEARFVGGEVTPYFTVDMSPLMHRHAIDAWLFGHTHHSVDFLDISGCRVVSNQLGYPTEPDPGFRDDLVIDI